MPKVPERPKIYHITHVRNLPRIIKAGMLWSDRKRLELNLACRVVGMDRIKRRRLEQIEVAPCHPGTRVGDYVPFYLCPRSVMLFLLHKGNHPDLDYSEGQEPILHLQADLRAVVDWANQKWTAMGLYGWKRRRVLLQFLRRPGITQRDKLASGRGNGFQQA